MEDIPQKDLEMNFNELFKATSSNSGEEELLRIASTYSRQLSAQQIKCLVALKFIATFLPDEEKAGLNEFVANWLEYKQYNNSAAFVKYALDSISLRKFINENTIKVNLDR